MKTLTATDARAQLYKLLDLVSESHTPLHIKGRRSNAVLVSEDDWNAIQETIYLLSQPGMRDSLLSSRNELISECRKDLEW